MSTGALVGLMLIGLVVIVLLAALASAMNIVQQVARGVHGGLVGQEALALDEVGDAHAVGHVRLVGERWLAVSGSGVVIPPGTTVLVTQVQGTTLVVLPLDGLDRPGTSRSGADGRTS